MLTYAADFWPLFWTIVGSGAVLTVLLTLGIATYSPKRSRKPELALVPVPAEQSGPYSTHADRPAA
ncbi:MAG TPA: hypothetical protein VFB06_20705 [Streptosporangiaceae bacterium]|nr:hypothetical protein [Streptosporangiaceae bacterium]